jgi:hypothetical protein
MRSDNPEPTAMRDQILATGQATSIIAAFLLACAGCSDSSSDPKLDSGSHSNARDAGGAEHDAGKPDAGRRVKERFVAIDLARITTREISKGDDGEAVYGPMKPLPGADVCVVQSRKAFAVGEPFEPLDSPICVKSVADELVHMPKVPANSDLIITVEHAGFQPWVLTERTGNYDVGGPGWAVNPAYALPLVKEGALDPWLESKPKPGLDDGLVAVGAAMRWMGDGPARPELLKPSEALTGHVDTIAPGVIQVSVEPAGASSFEMTTVAQHLTFVSLPGGDARFKFKTDNEHLSCASTGGTSGELLGLPAEGKDTLELPVLADHIHFVGVLCNCANGPGDGELLDLPTCTFAPADASDADAGQP